MDLVNLYREVVWSENLFLYGFNQVFSILFWEMIFDSRITLVFLNKIVVQDKKDPGDDEWKADAQDDAQTDLDRMVVLVVPVKKVNAAEDSGQDEQDASFKLPLPCNGQ